VVVRVILGLSGVVFRELLGVIEGMLEEKLMVIEERCIDDLKRA
jgi:hypothetical protein